MRKFAILLVFLLFAGLQVVLAQKTITGKVTSKEDGLGIPGVRPRPASPPGSAGAVRQTENHARGCASPVARKKMFMALP